MQVNEKSRIINRVKSTYSWLSDEELFSCWDMSIADYARIRYPSTNNRPEVKEVAIDFYTAEWLYQRMLDILSRAGGLNLTAYKENGLNLTYGGSYIDPQLVAMIMPTASVPL